MSFWEWLALLSVVVTIYGLINNRTIKTISRDTHKVIQEEAKSVREILDRIEKGQTEARKEMAEAIKYLADLIVSEGEKTRQAIKA